MRSRGDAGEALRPHFTEGVHDSKTTPELPVASKMRSKPHSSSRLDDGTPE